MAVRYNYDIESGKVVFHGMELDLSDHPRMLTVFKMAQMRREFTSEHVLKALFPDTDFDKLSARLRNCRRNTAIKLISRCRIKARYAFGAHWFHHDPYRRVYSMWDMPPSGRAR